MITIKDKKECCGCTACKEICPKKCIAMQIDNEGFLYPKVDESICINCNLCNKVCPIINKEKMISDVKAYAAYIDNDKIRLKSSSGGLFTVFANYIFSQGGVVAGAAFNDNFLVEHVLIENKDELHKLQGSKYLQSNMNDCYSKTKKYLDQNIKVLFTGTACQIEGLKRYLRKDYSNLYTIDVLCHGVPSPKVWKKYITEKESEYGSPLKQIFFRQKEYGWKKYALSLKFEDKTYLKDHHDDAFMKLFLSEICLRPSCHDCKFKEFPRISDLTIGDAWGIQNHMPEMDDDKGTSVLISNSEKGNELINSIRDQLIIKEGNLDTLLSSVADSRKSVKMHSKRTLFFSNLDNSSINQLLTYVKVPFVKTVINKAKWKIKKCIKFILK